MGMFNMVYVFNFCKPNLNCHFVPVAVYEGLEVMGNLTDNCDIVGLLHTREVVHIPEHESDYGIQISFHDETKCIEKAAENKVGIPDKPRKAEFNVVCSSSNEENFRLT